MTATLPVQTIPENPAAWERYNLCVTESRMTIEARGLRKGDYLPFARRVVVDIDVADDGRLTVTTRCPALTGPTWVHRWGPSTPVVIAPRGA